MLEFERNIRDVIERKKELKHYVPASPATDLMLLLTIIDHEKLDIAQYGKTLIMADKCAQKLGLTDLSNELLKIIDELNENAIKELTRREAEGA